MRFILLIVIFAYSTYLKSQDVSAPELISFSVVPQVVDIGNGPGQVTISIEATDDLSGAHPIFAFYNQPNGSQTNSSATLVSGNRLDGVWEKTYTIPQFSQTGTGTIDPLRLCDMVGNCIDFDFQDLVDLGFDPDFEIIDNNSQDISAPELINFSMVPQIIDISNGPGQITISIEATDDLSGAHPIFAFYNQPNGSQTNSSATLVSGNRLDGVWEKTYTIPQFSQTGTGTIDPLRLCDMVGNCINFDFQDLVNLGFDPDFEIIGGNALPVVFSSGLRIEDRNLIWTTSHEYNNRRFVVERSNGGILFESIGDVESSNTNVVTHYSYIDKNQPIGDNYYRIKQVDWSGDFAYSNIVRESSGTMNIFKVHPNPFKSVITVNVINTCTISILDNYGRSIRQIELVPGANKINLSKLDRGLYIICSEEKVFRIIKN